MSFCSSPPKFSSAYSHAARKFHIAPPELLGSGVMTSTPSFIRSSQSSMPFSLPFLTKKTIVDV